MFAVGTPSYFEPLLNPWTTGPLNYRFNRIHSCQYSDSGIVWRTSDIYFWDSNGLKGGILKI